jgi:thiol-disulfide isomerase/thioredoxin
MQRRHLLSAVLAAGAGQPAVTYAGARAAPGFPGIEAWLNTVAPADVPATGNRATLVNFWTYSCINARRTLPYLRRWDAEYGPSGLRIVGIHTPEFGFEHLRSNVEEAVRDLGIRYPVGQDNGYRTWRAWSNRAWPAFYLLDAEGKVVLQREGEGHAHAMEGAIRGLLGLSPQERSDHPTDDADLSHIETPEIYFGATHSTPQDPSQSPHRGEATYSFGSSAGPLLNRYALDGTWSREADALVLRSRRGALRLRFSAAKLHVVATAPAAANIQISVDGGTARMIGIERPTLYTLLDGETYGEHLLEMEAAAPGLTLFSATFG